MGSYLKNWRGLILALFIFSYIKSGKFKKKKSHSTFKDEGLQSLPWRDVLFHNKNNKGIIEIRNLQIFFSRQMVGII